MSYKGKYKPINPQKYIGDIDNIIYRSLLERRFMLFCDKTPSVLKWSSEEIIVPYYFYIDKKMHKYFVDFVVQMEDRNGEVKTYLIEIKPEKQTKQPEKKKKTGRYLREVFEWEKNKAKWSCARKYAEDKNWEFKILTEYDIFKSRKPKQ